MANVYKTMSLQKLQSIDSPIYLIICMCEDQTHTHTQTHAKTQKHKMIYD